MHVIRPPEPSVGIKAQRRLLDRLASRPYLTQAEINKMRKQRRPYTPDDWPTRDHVRGDGNGGGPKGRWPWIVAGITAAIAIGFLLHVLS